MPNGHDEGMANALAMLSAVGTRDAVLAEDTSEQIRVLPPDEHFLTMLYLANIALHFAQQAGAPNRSGLDMLRALAMAAAARP